MTSVSVWVWNLWPRASSSARSSRKLYTSPLKVMASWPSSLNMG